MEQNGVGAERESAGSLGADEKRAWPGAPEQVPGIQAAP